MVPLLALPLGFAQVVAAAPASPTLEPPRLLSELNVPYPADGAGAADVLLTVTVNADGTVRAAVPTVTNEPFSGVAARAALDWRYQPATRGGNPVAARIRVQITFRPPVSAPAPAPPSASAPASAAASAPESITEVNVRGAREEPSRTASLTRAEVRQIPGVFGDPFRAVEIMPGVTPIVSGLPFFYIRGAPPGDVGYYLDGVRVPYLFHVGVGPSVVHPALIDRVDLYPGGYPARYGRFAGGIVAGETVGPADAVRGEYNLRPFDAGALIETPFDGGRGTLLLGGRYSFTGLLLSLTSPDTVLSYWDYQARATYDFTPRDRLGVFVFGADDFLGQKASGVTQTLFGTQFHRADLRYDHRLDADGTLRTAITFGEDLTDAGDGRSVRDRLTGARTEVAYRLSRGALVRMGVDAEADKYDVVTGSATLGPAEAALAANYFPSRTDVAAGVRADAVFTIQRGLEVTPGARLDFFGSQGTTAVAIDPRLGARVAMTPRSHLLWAMGIAHQPPAFPVPVPGFQPGGLKGGLQTAAQESAGVEWELGGTTATATVFHNGFFNMSDAFSATPASPDGCLPGSFPTETLGGDPGGVGRSDTCGSRFTPGTLGPDRSGGGGQAAEGSDATMTVQTLEARTNGTAYGLELFIKRKLTERFGGFLSYTLSRSTRTFGNQDFLASFDRTHVLNAAGAYDLGRNWRAGARVVFYTCLLYTSDAADE